MSPTSVLNVVSAFRDPDGEVLTYTAALDAWMPTDPMHATPAPVVQLLANSTEEIIVFGDRPGVAAFTVTATDGAGQSATQSFTVTFVAAAPPNQRPQTVGVLPAVALALEGSAYPVGVAGVFMGPGG